MVRLPFAVLILSISLQLTTLMDHIQPCGSQIPQQCSERGMRRSICTADPRVGCASTAHPGASSTEAAKSSGQDTRTFPMTWMRKRAYRRACRRAGQNESGGTMYRGHWCTSRELQSRRVLQSEHAPATAAAVPTVTTARVRTRNLPGRRLKIMTYNVGGVTTDLCDTLCHWLNRNQDTGCATATGAALGTGQGGVDLANTRLDPNARYSGIGMVISRRIASSATTSFCTWLPGRLLQARCESATMNLDLLCANNDSQGNELESQRGKFWMALSRAVGSIPARNVLVRGLLSHSSRGPDREFQTILEEHRLCLLNTWGKARPGSSATFRNHNTATQIDFIAVRKPHADARAKQAHPVALDPTSLRGERGPNMHL